MITVKFNQKFLMPEQVDQVDYSKIFKLYILKAENNQIIHPLTINGQSTFGRNLQEIDSNSSSLTFGNKTDKKILDELLGL